VKIAEELSAVPVLTTAREQPRTARLVLFYASLAAALLQVWQIGSSLTLPLFLPSPALTLASAASLANDGTLWKSIEASYLRILVGWGCGSILGAMFGLAMGTNRVVRFVLDPYLQIFRFLPAIAILPTLILWLGTGETSKIVLIVYATCFIVALSTMDGALRVEKEKVRAAQCLGASRKQIFWLVVLPATMPSIITGIRLGMGGSFLAIVSAEMLAANQGLGFIIENSRLYMLTSQVFVAIAVLGALGLLTDRLIRLLTARLGFRFQVKT
jgi:NitT/TauT family transport system permease protein